MLALVAELKQRYPKALILGHNHFNRNKACPCFDVRGDELARVGT